MIASYQSLTGFNIYYWFATRDACYVEEDYYVNWEGKPLDERGYFIWSSNIPAIQGLFPGAALMFREGYVKQGEPVIIEERTLDDMWKLKRPIITEDQGHDANRDSDITGKQNDAGSGVDSLVYLTGPVKVKYDAEKSNVYVKDLSKYIDKANKTVRSVTGELATDYGKGVFTVNTPRAKGAAGFLNKAGVINLGGATIECANDYLSIAFVSMDKLPLKTSKKILLQAASVMRPEGFETVPDIYEHKEDGKTTKYECERIVKTGHLPFVSEDFKVKATLDNAIVKKWHLLDSNGEIRESFDVTRNQSGAVEIALPADAMYIVLE